MGGFSLIEALVAMVVLTLILVVCFGILNTTEKAWKASSEKIDEFQAARSAFEKITRTLSLATLNTYYDYYDSGRNRRLPSNASTFVPDVYGRQSELEFVSGKALVTGAHTQVTHSVFFTTPLGYTPTSDYSELGKLLNAIGFYIEFNSDATERPDFLSLLSNPPAPRWRYRLLEFQQPSENLAIYKVSDNSWIASALASASPPVYVIAENILACVILPKAANTSDNLASEYEYDSRTAWTSGTQPATMHQLPPLVHIVLIAASEASMARLQNAATTPPDLGFSYAEVFQSAASLDQDLTTVTEALERKRIHFRVFQADVALREARWSP
ncbi:MAG: Verru_Chthon cassette protein C [Chthoniobacteraceae bacterium]